MDTITTIQNLLTWNGSARPVTVALTPSESRLIAAAPELLAACKLAAQWMHDNNEGDEPLRMIRAAIAKAIS